MRQYTTPTMRLFVEDRDLTGWDVRVTIAQGGKKLTISDPAIENDETGSMLTFTLTQAQTGMFADSSVGIQVNAIDQDGRRIASPIVRHEVGANLLSMEITYGE